jgi:hypothetical protein
MLDAHSVTVILAEPAPDLSENATTPPKGTAGLSVLQTHKPFEKPWLVTNRGFIAGLSASLTLSRVTFRLSASGKPLLTYHIRRGYMYDNKRPENQSPRYMLSFAHMCLASDLASVKAAICKAAASHSTSASVGPNKRQREANGRRLQTSSNLQSVERRLLQWAFKI